MLRRTAVAAALLAPALVLPQTDNVIRVNTRLVQVNVVVQGKQGPVDDLTKDDFVIQDHGKPRSIAFFSVDRAKAVAGSPRVPAPNTFTNDPGQGSRPVNVSIILIDGLNTHHADQAYARQQIIKYLEQKFDGKEQVALYALGSSLHVLQDFTSDPVQLTRFLRKYKGIATPSDTIDNAPPSNTGNEEMDSMLDEMNAVFEDQAQVNRTLRTYSALEAIAGHVSRVPGRKNLIWMSSSFPLTIGFDDPSAFGNPRREQRTFSEERERAVRALNNANIAIYPVDARGLVGMPSLSAATAGGGNARNPKPMASMTPKGIDTMQELADATGGRAFYNTNDLATAVHKAVEDSAVTYTLGFYPEPQDLDGRFHEIKLQVKRKGVSARYRKGYLALKDETPGDKEREFMIETALWSPLPSAGITLAGVVRRVDKPEPNLIQFIIAADAHRVRLEQAGDRWTGKIEVIFAQKDREGRVIDAVRDTVNLNLTATTRDEILRKGMVFTRAVRPKPDLAQLRVVICDYDSGELGSLAIPLAQVK